MKQASIERKRAELLKRMPVSGEMVRGSLLERVVRHTRGCAKCARGEGHPVSVLTVSYAGGRTRQISLRREQVTAVRHWLDNYQRLKETIEAICELNHQLLRRSGGRAGGKRRD